MKEDDAIQSFFKEMRKADERLSVPAFPEQPEPVRRKQWPMVLYAAATIAAIIVALIFFVDENERQMPDEQVVILIGEDEMQTNSLIEDESFSEWHSPTSFLVEDF